MHQRCAEKGMIRLKLFLEHWIDFSSHSRAAEIFFLQISDADLSVQPLHDVFLLPLRLINLERL